MDTIETSGIIDKTGVLKIKGKIDKKYLNKYVRVLILLPEETEEKQYKIDDLKGLGAEIWNDIDAAEYVKEERKWE